MSFVVRFTAADAWYCTYGVERGAIALLARTICVALAAWRDSGGGYTD
jgi:hypothetical protein